AAIRAAVLGPDDANVGVFNSDVVYGDETEAAEILTLCGNLPMFATRRLVVVKEVGALGAHEAERLLPCLEAPVETTCLVLTGGKVDGRVKFFQALKQAAVSVDCAPLDAQALPAWVQEQAGALGLRLDQAARESLIEASGGALGVLCREMEKLAAYVAPNTRVTAADVEAVQGADTGGSVHDLIDALQRRDRVSSLRSLGKVLDAGEPPLKVLGFLAACWRNMWRARKFSQEMLRDFELFREIDSRLKGGGGGRRKERLEMERLVLNLCRGAGRATPSRPFASAR
ncbi:MAG: DNA polymerase III subunit delta, partial [Nitrospirae bacterium 13_2_20CM_2_61_4]